MRFRCIIFSCRLFLHMPNERCETHTRVREYLQNIYVQLYEMSQKQSITDSFVVNSLYFSNFLAENLMPAWISNPIEFKRETFRNPRIRHKRISFCTSFGPSLRDIRVERVHIPRIRGSGPHLSRGAARNGWNFGPFVTGRPVRLIECARGAPAFVPFSQASPIDSGALPHQRGLNSGEAGCSAVSTEYGRHLMSRNVAGDKLQRAHYVRGVL